MYKHDYLNKIDEVSKYISDCEFSRLRIKEELLSLLVGNPGVPLRVKGEAFEAIKRINQKQLELLGNKLKGA